MTTTYCPCKSKKPYDHCCKPYHTISSIPPDARALMRSRYSAYALALAQYIINTTHPNHPDRQKKPWPVWQEEILSFCKQTEFLDLEILSFDEGPQEAFVTFTASLRQQGTSFAFTEKSRFLKEGLLWLYRDALFL